MQTSFATISQLMVVLLAAGTLAAPLSTTAAEEPKLEARRDSRCADEGFGCTQLCYPGTNKCGWVAIPPPRAKTAKRDEVNETIEVAEAEADSGDAAPIEARQTCDRDRGFGCSYRCYGNQCTMVPNPPPRSG